MHPLVQRNSSSRSTQQLDNEKHCSHYMSHLHVSFILHSNTTGERQVLSSVHVPDDKRCACASNVRTWIAVPIAIYAVLAVVFGIWRLTQSMRRVKRFSKAICASTTTTTTKEETQTQAQATTITVTTTTTTTTPAADGNTTKRRNRAKILSYLFAEHGVKVPAGHSFKDLSDKENVTAALSYLFNSKRGDVPHLQKNAFVTGLGLSDAGTLCAGRCTGGICQTPS